MTNNVSILAHLSHILSLSVILREDSGFKVHIHHRCYASTAVVLLPIATIVSNLRLVVWVTVCSGLCIAIAVGLVGGISTGCIVSGSLVSCRM